MSAKPLLIALLLACFIYQPSPSLATEPLRIVVISDINGRYGSIEYHKRVSLAVAQIISLKPALVISTGDMVAGQRPAPKLQTPELEAMWNSFHQTIRQPLAAAGIPFLMTPGNHDASAYPGYQEEREAYNAYHSRHPPALKPLDHGWFPYYYAVHFQGVLLVSLDATTSGELSQQQLTWLTALMETRTPEAPLILFGHLPMQPISIGRERDVIDDSSLEQLLQTAGNATYLSGHHHAYFPGNRLDINMFSIGNLGGNRRNLIGKNGNTGFSFALLEIGAKGDIQITGFTGATFEQEIDTDLLPKELGTGSQLLQRYDIARSAKTSE